MGRRAASRKIRKQIARAAGQSGSTLAKWDSLGIPRKLLVGTPSYIAPYIPRWGKYFGWKDTQEAFQRVLQEIVDHIATKNLGEPPKVVFVDYVNLTTHYGIDAEEYYTARK